MIFSISSESIFNNKKAINIITSYNPKFKIEMF